MRVGIEKIEGYTSRLSLELEDLAVARRMARTLGANLSINAPAGGGTRMELTWKH